MGRGAACARWAWRRSWWSGKPGQGTGLDLHVFIERDDKPMRRTFGVLLRGAPASLTAEQASAALGPALGPFRGLRKFTYPVCLLLFTMQEEQAIFTWRAEPVLTGMGPKLVHHEAARCVPLTGAVLDEVVGRVVAWYDAVAGVLIAVAARAAGGRRSRLAGAFQLQEPTCPHLS